MSLSFQVQKPIEFEKDHHRDHVLMTKKWANRFLKKEAQIFRDNSKADGKKISKEEARALAQKKFATYARVMTPEEELDLRCEYYNDLVKANNSLPPYMRKSDRELMRMANKWDPSQIPQANRDAVTKKHVRFL